MLKQNCFDIDLSMMAEDQTYVLIIFGAKAHILMIQPDHSTQDSLSVTVV
jgi:hypothetical protein